MNWYSRMLSKYPWVILLASGALSILSIVCSLTLQTLPDFSDPQEGFEARGTEISRKLITWDNLLDSISHIGPLTTNPIQPVTAAKNGRNTRKNNRKKQKDRKKKLQRRSIDTVSEIMEHINMTVDTPLDRWRREAMPLLSSDHRIAWLCGDPLSDFSRVVYQSRNGESLFTHKSIISMCTLETMKLKSVPQYTELCESKGPVDCCPGWSIGGYIALLYNRTSCFTITEDDVKGTLSLLISCSPHYLDGSLTASCGLGASRCSRVPPVCSQHNAVFTIFHFLTDTDFPVKKEGEKSLTLTNAISFLPLARSSQMLEYYKNLDVDKLCDGVTEIVAMDFGLKDALFNSYLLEDATYLLAGLLMIFLSVWSFTTSLTVTMACITSIGYSLGLAYFTYTFILRLSFFPFMNILAVVIALGVGADDTFILSRVWSQKQSDFLLHSPSDSGSICKLESLVTSTFHHALISMLVTSITTIAAFLSSYISNITAIKCFSIFSSLTILWNFVLMLTWVPAWIILHHKILVIKLATRLPNLPRQLEPGFTKVISWTFVLSRWIRNFFERILPYIIVKPRAIWICLSIIVLILACVATFYMPGINLPQNSEMQLFNKDHPFEKYEMVFKQKFGFEKTLQLENGVSMPLRFVFGTIAQDNGDYMNPGRRGEVLMDPDFDMSSKEAQSWLYKFCMSIKKQPFYKYTHGDLQLSNCFIITFKEWMYRPCYNDLSKENHRPCCRDSVFPFEPNIFNECLLAAVDDLYETPSFLWLPGVAGPKFDIKTKKVSAVIVEYESSVQFSYHFEKMQEFYQDVEKWFTDSMADAPLSLQNGFFVSYLEFYDLQKHLLEGTYMAIAVAMTISFLVLLISTRNIILSILAIFTVFTIILITIGVLVVLGWELNILESVIITVAIGLSVDFTLHYGIMYKLSGYQDRDKSVCHSVASMSSPVTMAAITTFSAGICLFPARVLAYIQIGTFIVVLMSISWLFSTFFFQSLMSSWGPTKSSSWSWSRSRSLCCGLEDDESMEDEVENIKKAFTVSDTMVSAVSHTDLQLDFRLQDKDPNPQMSLQQSFGANGYHRNGDREMVSLGMSRQADTSDHVSPTPGPAAEDVRMSVKQRRSQSYVKDIDLKDRNRRKSMDNLLQKQYSGAKYCKSSCEILCQNDSGGRTRENGVLGSPNTQSQPVSSKRPIASNNHSNQRQENK